MTRLFLVEEVLTCSLPHKSLMISNTRLSKIVKQTPNNGGNLGEKRKEMIMF